MDLRENPKSESKSNSQKKSSKRSAQASYKSDVRSGVRADVKSNIKGWGVDLDPKNRPAYPMWKRPADGTGAHYDHPPQQVAKVKIHKSTERPDLTAVFGTVSPPKGLSGLMRNFAYAKFSEGQLSHWLILLMSDRVDMIEGVIEDLGHGHVPNLYKEMGLASEWKHNRPKFIGKLATYTGVAVGAYYLFSRKNKPATS